MRTINVKHEDKTYHLIDREWEEYHGITLVAMVINEEEKIVDFLKHVRPIVNRIVLIDGGSKDKTVDLALPLVDCLKVIPFEGSYANQRNKAMELSYTDWSLYLDPDERLTDKLAGMIRGLIETDEYDCYDFPRREFRDGKEDKKVYPDYQTRLFRTYCRFIRPVHEEVVGYQNKKEIPANENCDIIHDKVGVRHTSRNTSYFYFERHYKHEMGIPGTQMKESFDKEYPHLSRDLAKGFDPATGLVIDNSPDKIKNEKPLELVKDVLKPVGESEKK